MNKSNLGANVGDIPRGVNRPEVNPAGLGGLFETPLTLGDSPATCTDQTVYSSLVIRQAGQRSNKTRWPNGRFMKAGSYYGGPVYKERHKEYLPYKELRPGLVSGLY